MTSQFVAFEDLEPATNALTDASSLRELAQPTLAATLDPSRARLILSDLEGFSLTPALNLLERWVVCDQLVADLVALESLNHSRSAHDFWDSWSMTAKLMPKASSDEVWAAHLARHVLGRRAAASPDKLGQLPTVKSVAARLGIAFTCIPPSVFTRCVTILGETSRAIQDARPDVPWNTFGFGLEKRYGEQLADFYHEAEFLGRSNLGVPRTLVYYETAAAAGIPLVLHPARFEEAQEIDRGCRDAYDAVKQVLQQVFEEPVRRQLESLGLSHDVAVPPLVSRLVQLAGEARISILEAAMEVKQSANAAAFRRWLSTIQAHLAEGGVGGKLEALRLLKELERVAARWTEEFDVKLGVAYKKRELRMSWVPRIGALLDLMDKPTVRDPILNRKGYLTFISWWFDHQP